MQKPRTPVWNWIVLLVFASLILGTASAEIGILLWVWVLISTIRQQNWRWLALGALLGPLTIVPSIHLVRGVLDYAGGTATFTGHGKPTTEFWNLDRECRCRWESAGCCVFGNEEFKDEPYRYAVRTLTKNFGLMKGAYAGPYPERDEAFKALDESQHEIKATDLISDPTRVGFPKNVPSDPRNSWWVLPEDETKIRFVKIDGAMIVLGHHDTCVLFEAPTGRIIARYVSR